MLHLNITMPEELKAVLDTEARREHLKRSTFVQKAVRVYLELKKKNALKDLLREGYAEMSGLSREISGEFGPLDEEALRHAD